MTQEALKLALEALSVLKPDNWVDKELQGRAWDAVKEALAQEQEPVAWMRQDGQKVTTASDRHNYPDYETRYSIPLYTTPPQRTEQEPVAQPASEEDMKIYKTIAANYHKDLSTPPQRTWVGLTDDEVAQGCKESWVTEQAWQSAVWWSEDKLKEKNT